MDKLLFLGVGSIARAVRDAAPETPAWGTTRGAPDSRFTDITPLAARDLNAVQSLARGASVVVSFPPDGRTDQELARAVAGAAGLVYLSSTAVYPATAGLVNETSPVAADGERALLRLAAEATWRSAGASIVRLPAFYGLSTGLHVSLARGGFRIPGAGTNVISRVHVDDAAAFVLAALTAPEGSLLLAGDREPATVIEVVSFVCELFGLSLPPSSEGTDVPVTLRGTRAVDSTRTRAEFGLQLAYPTYREGYCAIYAGLHKSSG